MAEKRLICEPATPNAPAVILLAGGAAETIPAVREVLDASGAPACRLAAFDAVDWDADYTPWKAEGRRDFSGGADALMPSLERAIEQLRSDGAPRVYLVGYSLGGLAALYFHTKLLADGCASCSGSLWYPNFIDYLTQNPPRGAVYFSLGGKEKNTRDELMSAIEDRTRDAYELCKRTAERTVFNHEPGGHFRDTNGRMARGIAWLLG